MKILVVDDSKAMRMIVKRTLRQAGFDGFDVVEAESAADALGIIASDSIDLVLTDWNMPEMTGIEMLEHLNEEGVEIRVGMITSRGSADMRARAQEAGALFLLTKPFTADLFRDALEPVLT